MKRVKYPLLTLVCALLIIGISLLANTCKKESLPADGSFSVMFLDVGQADSALVQCDGHYMLIDGGNKADSDKIYSVLKKHGVEKLDIVVGTHAHEDHIGGLPGAFSYTTADLTLCPVTDYESEAFDDFAKYAKEKGGGITVPEVGDTYSLGSAKVHVLAVNSLEYTNDTSIVLRIDYGKTSFLFMGDAEIPAEEVMLYNDMDVEANVIKIGHHGSDTSSGAWLLRRADPQYAVISVGKDNAYGHPSESVLWSLAQEPFPVKVFRTDLDGDIFCISNGTNVQFVEKDEYIKTIPNYQH